MLAEQKFTKRAQGFQTLYSKRPKSNVRSRQTKGERSPSRRIKKSWKTTINKEFQTLEAMQCWKVVQQHPPQKLLNTELVLKQKYDETGTIGRYKAILVVCGKKEENNCEATFPPIAHILR